MSFQGRLKKSWCMQNNFSRGMCAAIFQQNWITNSRIEYYNRIHIVVVSSLLGAIGRWILSIKFLTKICTQRSRISDKVNILTMGVGSFYKGGQALRGTFRIKKASKFFFPDMLATEGGGRGGKVISKKFSRHTKNIFRIYHIFS
jgi:hypothetical protein